MKITSIKKSVYLIIALTIALPFTMAPSLYNTAENTYAQLTNSELEMSFEEILLYINERLGSDLEAVPSTCKSEMHASEIFYSGQELLDIIDYYEKSAREVLEINALVDSIWYERTGILVEDAEWISCDMNLQFNYNLFDDSTLSTTNSTLSYRSEKKAWSPNGWITTTGTGVVNNSPRAFGRIDNVTANSIRLNGLVGESYKATSFTVSYIDTRRTAAVNITGTLLKTPPPPLKQTTQTLNVYTEYYAGSP